VLALLARHGLRTTFFLEGWSAERYPATVAAVAEAGHEIACHGWQHEPTGSLPPEEGLATAARGVAALRGLGLEVEGFRPPGGLVGPLTPPALAELGLRYASPAGTAGGSVDGAAYLPFPWVGVDALFYFPPFAPLRTAHGYPEAPLGPDALQAALDEELARTVAAGGHLVLVFHAFLLGPPERLALVDRFVGRVLADERLWVAPMRDVAAFVLAHPERFAGRAELAEHSWM
jgi:peptidoglycan/xylan/chitin deacetylase (PgdA/CDA1 family)